MTLLISCKEDKPITNSIEKIVIKPEEAEEVLVSAQMYRIDKELLEVTQKEDIERIFIKYPAFFKQYLVLFFQMKLYLWNKKSKFNEKFNLFY